MSKGRLLAMGDIHDQSAKMHEVLEKCRYNPEKDRLVLLGDYGDSAEVVQAV